MPSPAHTPMATPAEISAGADGVIDEITAGAARVIDEITDGAAGVMDEINAGVDGVTDEIKHLNRGLTKAELNNIYAGADGVMDEVEEIMMKYDADQSGLVVFRLTFCLFVLSAVVFE
ncbi:unnamed protein product [Polarella glacialis]|uniref:Uncharacterized protein n=1 Tax=Polarella glacialis TaxID=89957 RepID=A0A813F1A3_POLGL|nr:unnamed protein product [Polarella glacialis]